MKQTSERLGVKIVGGVKEVNTAWAGSSLLIDLFRKLEMDTIANKVLPAKRLERGISIHGLRNNYQSLDGNTCQTWNQEPMLLAEFKSNKQ
jgi:hypothetical protein